MNKFIILFVIMLIVIISMLASRQSQPLKQEYLVNSILVTSAKIIESKYNLEPCGIGVSMPGGPIREVTLCFDTKYPHTKDQLRDLLIKSAQELLLQINTNEAIQEFLKNRPFSIKNIQILIYNHDKNGRSLRDPEISNAQILQGIITYATIDPQNSFKYKSEFEESYEEAFKLLK